MREFLFILSSERRMVRLFAMTGLAIAALAFAGTHGLKAAAGFLSGEVFSQRVPAASQTARTYTVTRSVLDDNPATGSIQALNQVRFDPCKK